MYPLGGFAEAPLSSYLSDDFPLISRPRGLKRLLMYPSFSFLLGVIFWKFSAAKKWLQRDFFKLGNAGLGPTRVQLILADLLLYPFGVKEGPKQHVLSHVPFGRFCLVTYPSEGTAASGASKPTSNGFGLGSGFLGQLGLGSGLRDPLG